MAKAIDAENGVGTIFPIHYKSNPVYLGTTGEGGFPPIGQEYERFSFTPTPGVDGILVFGNVHNTSKTFYRYSWNGDLLHVALGMDSVTRPNFSESRESTLIVGPFRGWYFTTDTPKDTNQNYKLVDLFEMLRFIDGKIGLKELYANSRSVARRAEYQVRMGKLYDLTLELGNRLRDENQRAEYAILSLKLQTNFIVLLRMAVRERCHKAEIFFPRMFEWLNKHLEWIASYGSRESKQLESR